MCCPPQAALPLACGYENCVLSGLAVTSHIDAGIVAYRTSHGRTSIEIAPQKKDLAKSSNLQIFKFFFLPLHAFYQRFFA
jgi:hypothetical protein